MVSCLGGREVVELELYKMVDVNIVQFFCLVCERFGVYL